MAHAVRSPGSALKPFIYAMAFDLLIIHPETVLEDRAQQFGDYAPSDFDGRFQGKVTAREALQYSLSLPAVAVLDRLGAGRFIAALGAAGIRLRLPEPAVEPGLAVPHRWKPEPGQLLANVTNAQASFYAGVARKP